MSKASDNETGGPGKKAAQSLASKGVQKAAPTGHDPSKSRLERVITHKPHPLRGVMKLTRVVKTVPRDTSKEAAKKK